MCRYYAWPGCHHGYTESDNRILYPPLVRCKDITRAEPDCEMEDWIWDPIFIKEGRRDHESKSESKSFCPDCEDCIPNHKPASEIWAEFTDLRLEMRRRGIPEVKIRGFRSLESKIWFDAEIETINGPRNNYYSILKKGHDKYRKGAESLMKRHAQGAEGSKSRR
jgi:hypothetical protein